VTVDASTGSGRLNADGSFTCPTANFTFTGTGFDLISLTDSTTDFIQVRVTDTKGNVVFQKIVNNYYGFNYGPLFAEDGTPVVDE
jgi:hypothetical protein